MLNDGPNGFDPAASVSSASTSTLLEASVGVPALVTVTWNWLPETLVAPTDSPVMTRTSLAAPVADTLTSRPPLAFQVSAPVFSVPGVMASGPAVIVPPEATVTAPVLPVAAQRAA